MAGADLVCRACGEPGRDAQERFCPACGVPLSLPVDSSASPVSERQERARKVKGQYSEGPLVRVAWARHQAEAELISGLLLEEGVASVARRSGGFDVPDFLAAGPRDILVAQSGAPVAREVLGAVGADGAASAVPEPDLRRTAASPAWVQAVAVVLVVIVLASTAAAVLLAVLS